MLLLIASGANALSGLGVVSRVPSLALLCGQQPPAILGVRSRQCTSRSYDPSAGIRTISNRRLYFSYLEEAEAQVGLQVDHVNVSAMIVVVADCFVSTAAVLILSPPKMSSIRVAEVEHEQIMQIIAHSTRQQQ